MTEADKRPAHLEPSELGTKDYWDQHYQNDLDNDGDDEEIPGDPSQLDSWFDDVDAPAKTLSFLTTTSFPLSPRHVPRKEKPKVLDLGTGNGSFLFALRLEAGYDGTMVGVDYSQQSVDLARRLWQQYSTRNHSVNDNVMSPADEQEINFYTIDLIHNEPQAEPWWPTNVGGFDLIHDKGTFDAVSLSSETVIAEDGSERRICEVYPRKVANMIAKAGFLLITTCNWTQEEIIEWFTVDKEGPIFLEVYDTIRYPVYEFGGQKGQGVAGVCFRSTK